MPRFRFSLLALFGFVAFAAVGCAALASATETWWSIILTATIGCLLFALLATMNGRSGGRAFWAGFAVVGWGYLAMVFVQLVYTDSTDDPPPLATSRLLESICEARFPQPKPVIPQSLKMFLDGSSEAENGSATESEPGPTRPVMVMVADPKAMRRFVHIGEAFFSLLFGLIGGLVARHLYLRRERQSPSKPPSG